MVLNSTRLLKHVCKFVVMASQLTWHVMMETKLMEMDAQINAMLKIIFNAQHHRQVYPLVF